MQVRRMSEKSTPRLRDLFVCVATTAVLSLILTPIFTSTLASKISNKPNLKKISAGAIAYAGDYDDAFPWIANGSERNLGLSMPGAPETLYWPLILLPYVGGDRRVYQDPRRDDLNGIWSGPPLDRTTPGYIATANTFRNQNRFPCFGVNYVFLSPLTAPQGGGVFPDPGTSAGETHTFAQAKDPANTVFYCVTSRGWVPIDEEGNAMQDTSRGYYVVNPPGMWGLSKEESPYLLMYNGAPCSGDWCGDADPKSPGHQRRTGYFYRETILGGNNVAFVDGHVQFMTDLQLTAGTNYWNSVPNGTDNGGGAKIIDKSKYIWDLNDDYYGLY